MKSINEVKTEELIEVIAEVLELETDEVETTSSLVDDLGADSLDLVDTSFSIGKKFGFKMPTKATLVVAQDLQPEEDMFVESGKLTELGAKLLVNSPSRYSDKDVRAGLSVGQVLSNTLVQHWIYLANYVVANGGEGDKVIEKYVRGFIEEHSLETEAD